ncbi:MAG: hypothetical protein WB799_05465 [Candidatus Sulfotelmatobacter sp.]
MPAMPDVPNVLKLRVLFDLNGKTTQGVRLFFAWSGTAPTVGACASIAAKLFSELTTAGIAAAMTTTYAMKVIECYDLTTATAGEGEHNGTVTGTRAGNPLQVDAAFVTSYEIARRYRGGHPRSYWPFGTSADLTGPQAFKSASVTAFLAVVNTALAGFVGFTASGCTVGAHSSVSYYAGFTAIENPITHRYRNVPKLRLTPVVGQVNSVIGRNYVGSFRRRRFKVA